MRHTRYRCGPVLPGLTVAQQIELSIGPGRTSAFADNAARRRAWERHRATLLALDPAGGRPWAAWFYDRTGKE